MHLAYQLESTDIGGKKRVVKVFAPTRAAVGKVRELAGVHAVTVSFSSATKVAVAETGPALQQVSAQVAKLVPPARKPAVDLAVVRENAEFARPVVQAQHVVRAGYRSRRKINCF